MLAIIVINLALINQLSPRLVSLTVLLTLLVAMALSVGFKKSRFFFAVLIIGLNYLFQVNYPHADQAQALFLILLPLNIFLLSISGERGIASLWGKVQFGIILLQILITFWLFSTGGIIQINVLQAEYANISAIFSFPTMQHLVISIFVLLITVLSIWQFNRPEGMFVGLIAALWLGFYLPGSPRSWPIMTFACAIMIILEIIKDMYRFAFVDELTGLYSRRCLNQDQLKLSGTYTIAMLDIDHFKIFNDTYGHDVGDQVLRYVASLMMRVPGGGRAYRYGGEEFTFIFAGKNKNEAIPYLEELRETMATRPFSLRSQDRPKKKPKNKPHPKKGNKKVPVTISIGVADNEKKVSGPEEVVKAADKALYKAKKGGRNRVCS